VKDFHPSLTCGFVVEQVARGAAGGVVGVHDEVVDDGSAVRRQVVDELLVARSHEPVLEEQPELGVHGAGCAARVAGDGGDRGPGGGAVVVGVVGVGDEYEVRYRVVGGHGCLLQRPHHREDSHRNCPRGHIASEATCVMHSTLPDG
jgi:hypothetical protein